MTAAECEAAAKGDLDTEDARRAVGKLWRHYKEHAIAMHGAARTPARDMNTREATEGARETHTNRRHEPRCTAYIGDWEEHERTDGTNTKKERRHRTSLQATEDDTSEGERVTKEQARKREEIAAYLEQRLESEDSEWLEQMISDTLPSGRPNALLRWDEEKHEGTGKGVWQGVGGTGHAQVTETHLTRDPLTRLYTRWDSFENGTEHAWATTEHGRIKVVMDNEEQRMLQDDHGSTSITETNKVAETTVPLHMVHHFTDVWTTDGPLTQETDAPRHRVVKMC